MNDKLTVYPYKVAKSKESLALGDLLDQIMNSPISKRNRAVNYVDIRIENIKFEGGLWYLDFIRFRHAHGPGKAAKQKRIMGFKFERDETFAEETAALYDPNSNYILIQANRFGVNAGGITNYLNLYSKMPLNFYELKPILDKQVEQRLLKKNIFRKVELKIDARRMGPEDIEDGIPLAKALEIGRGSGADIVDITISVARHNKIGLINSTIAKTYNWFKKTNGGIKGEEKILGLKLSGKDDLDTKLEALDLVSQKLSLEFSDIKLGPDLRFPIDERWARLKAARLHWSKTLA